MQSTFRRCLRLVVLPACFGMVVTPLVGQSSQKKESVCQEIQKAAQQPGQPAHQPTQPGPTPAKAGQQSGPQAGANNGAANDTGPFTPPAGTKIDASVMAPVEQGAQFAISPHGEHVATVSHRASQRTAPGR